LNQLFDEILQAAQNRLIYLALFGALAIPDICAGMESVDGRTNEKRYIEWFDRWAGPKYNGMVNGQDCYGLRCSMLHQGRAQPHKGVYSRVIFLAPNDRRIVMHRNVLNDALNLDIQRFCAEMVESARAWLPTVEGTPEFETNLANFLTIHPDGIPPYIVGMPVIG
jgi:hypothetical protein